MELLSQEQAAVLPFSASYRVTSFNSLPLLIGSPLFALLFLYFGHQTGLAYRALDEPSGAELPFTCYAIAAGCVGLTVFAAVRFKAERSNASWVMRFAPAGILLNVRTATDPKATYAEPSVVRIAWDEIKSVGALTETRQPTYITKKKQDNERLTFLEIDLKAPDTGAAQKAIMRRFLKRPGHAAVSLAAPDRIRVLFHGPDQKVTPTIDNAATLLTTRCLLIPAREHVYQSWINFTPDEARVYATMLCDEGSVATAATVLGLCGMEYSAAKKRIATRQHALAELCAACGAELPPSGDLCAKCNQPAPSPESFQQ